jgi:hypothetical protein
LKEGLGVILTYVSTQARHYDAEIDPQVFCRTGRMATDELILVAQCSRDDWNCRINVQSSARSGNVS